MELKSRFHDRLLGVLVAAATVALSSSVALGQEAQQPAKVAGLPVGIIKVALNNPDPATRQKYFALITQRLARSAGARQKLLAADPIEVGTRLARFQYSAEMLASARDNASDSSVRNKLTQIIAAIEEAH